MNQADLQALNDMIVHAMHSEESFTKVWSVVGPILSGIVVALLALAGQVWTAHLQRKHERKSATEDSDEKAQLAESELKMWNIASQRKATSKVAQMRQVWINNLRIDAATYITLQKELMYRWHAILGRVQEKKRGEVSEVEMDRLFGEFRAELPKLHQDALEVRLRIVLHLNPTEDESKQLVGLMDELEQTIRKFNRGICQINPDQLMNSFMEQEAKTISAVQVILANEWRVVKRELGVQSDMELMPSAAAM